MPVYEISCPHCSELFELNVGLDIEDTIKHLVMKIKESDGVRGYLTFRTYSEILGLCGDKARSLGAHEFDACVRSANNRGLLEKRKIGHSWKFRYYKPYEYSSSPSRKRRRRTGTMWGD